MAYLTIDEAKANVDLLRKGNHVALIDPDGRVRIGTVRIREVRCGKKNCSKCPHRIYAYAQYRVGKKVKQKYIGVAR